MFCTVCGAANEDEARFCAYCGEHLKRPANGYIQDLTPKRELDRGRTKRQAGGRRPASRAFGVVGLAGLIMLVFCVYTAIMVANRDNRSGQDEEVAARTENTAAASYFVSCNELAILTVASPVSESAVVVSNGVTYEVFGAAGALEFPQYGGLLALDDERSWLVLTLIVRNDSASTVNLNSNDFRVWVDGETFRESATTSGDVASAMGLKDMGEFIGTDIRDGESMTFSLAYQVPMYGSDYELRLVAAESQIDLVPFLANCHTPSRLIPTPTPTPIPSPSPTPLPLPTPAPTPKPAPTSRARPTPENVTYRPNDDTLDVYRYPSMHTGERVTISGWVVRFIEDAASGIT